MFKPLPDLLWDTWCVGSLVGIWPRFIEPRLLTTTTLEIRLPGLKRDLKALAFSDLHFQAGISSSFLQKILRKSVAFKPDLVFFLGDFLCDSELYAPSQLQSFLQAFKPPLGGYAVLGNHDYAAPVSVNNLGDYDLCEKENPFKKAFQRLAYPLVLSRKVTERAKKVKEHPELLAVLKKTPFKLLNNQTQVIQKGDLHLNITGLGEHMLGRVQPAEAFKKFQPGVPGIVLVHNPDAVPHLIDQPGNLILSGHTHGGQINLPWIWKRLSRMEEPQFKEGRFEFPSKTLYVSRGVGSVKPFRWYAPPELVLIHLKGA